MASRFLVHQRAVQDSLQLKGFDTRRRAKATATSTRVSAAAETEICLPERTAFCHRIQQASYRVLEDPETRQRRCVASGDIPALAPILVEHIIRVEAPAETHVGLAVAVLQDDALREHLWPRLPTSPAEVGNAAPGSGAGSNSSSADEGGSAENEAAEKLMRLAALKAERNRFGQEHECLLGLHLSMLNHSHEPNAMVGFVNFGAGACVALVCALRPISAGEELDIDYGMPRGLLALSGVPESALGNGTGAEEDRRRAAALETWQTSLRSASGEAARAAAAAAVIGDADGASRVLRQVELMELVWKRERSDGPAESNAERGRDAARLMGEIIGKKPPPAAELGREKRETSRKEKPKGFGSSAPSRVGDQKK